MFLVYKDRFNVVEAFELADKDYSNVENDDLVYFYDIRDKTPKTFRKCNIISQHNSFEEAKKEAETRQKDYEIRKEPETFKSKFKRPNPRNTEGKLEVCFTGFSEEEKEELRKIAVENDIFVVKSVTVNLGLLVCGANAGPKKIQKNAELNNPTVQGIQGFKDFITDGVVDL